MMFMLMILKNTFKEYDIHSSIIYIYYIIVSEKYIKNDLILS